jgi:hypothetical protein
VLTPPPIVTRAWGATPTPPPVLRSVRPRRTSQPRPPLALEDEAGRRRARKAGLAGLLLIAFSCGMMFMVAVDRLWPRPRAACEGVPAETLAAATPARGVEVVREAAPAAAAASVAEAQTAAPPAAQAAPKAAAAPAVEPVPAARLLPVARPLPAPAARVVRAPVVAPRATVPMPAPVVATPRTIVPAPAVAAPRTIVPAPAPVARGRAPVTARKRAGGPSPSGPASETAATESWNDPFAQ